MTPDSLLRVRRFLFLSEGFAMHKAVKEMRKLLAAAGSEQGRKDSDRFFKESMPCYGVKTTEMRRIAKEILKGLKGMDKAEIFRLCDDLWKSGMLEERFAACDWSYAQRAAYVPEDLDVFERWVKKYVDNWATCDTLCNHNVGDLVQAYPELIGRLRAWTGSKNRWMKRAAAVSLIIPARRGLFLDDVFLISDALLPDTDDMVQKGYGWMLKAASEAHRDAVYAYVVGKKAVMPRTAYRYALEKMPKAMRAEAMKK